MPHNPHDAFAKSALSQPQVARSFVSQSLPLSVVASLDLDAIEIQPESYIDEQLRSHFADMVYRIPLKHSKAGDREYAWVYVLIEHKSYQDRMTSWQLLRYMVKLWEAWQREHPKARYLPPILPVILYHGNKRWTAPTNFRSLIDTGNMTAEAADAIVALLPDFTPQLRDLSQEEDAALMHNVWNASTFLLMKYIRSPQLSERLPQLFGLFGQLAEDENGIEYLYTLLNFVSEGAPTLTAIEARALIEQQSNQPGGEVMATLVEQWQAEGRAEGEAKGKAKGKAESLLILIQLRWGQPEISTRQQVQQADEAQLERWISRIIDAKSLAELLESRD